MVKKIILYLMVFSVTFLSAGASAFAWPGSSKNIEKFTSIDSFLKFDDAQTLKYKAINTETCAKMKILKQSLIDESKILNDLQAKNADSKEIKSHRDVLEALNKNKVDIQNQYIEKLITIMTPAQKKKFKKYKFEINDEGCVCGGKCDCGKLAPCPVNH